MKKISVAFVLLGLLCVTSTYAENNVNLKDEISSALEMESRIVKNIIDEIAVAAASGDEQLIAKILISAVKANPTLADRIMAGFMSDKDVKASSKEKVIDIPAIINSVAGRLQKQKGGEKLAAVVLAAFAPAAGASKQAAPKTVKKDDLLPPTLPLPGQTGGTKSILPKENPSQTSAN